MGKIARSIPFSELIVRIESEYRNQNSIFGIYHANFFKKEKCFIASSSQFAQNSVCLYLFGVKEFKFDSVDDECLKSWFALYYVKSLVGGPEFKFFTDNGSYDEALFEEYKENLSSYIKVDKIFKPKFENGLATYSRKENLGKRKKIDSKLPLFDCFIAPCLESKSQEYCSNIDYGDAYSKPFEFEQINDSLSDEEYFASEDKLFDSIMSKKAKCLSCPLLCTKCVDICPNRANVLIDMRFSENTQDAYQIIHLDAFCNECGKCEGYCNHIGEPYKDKFTLFNCLADFEASLNQGFYCDGGDVLVRIEGRVENCKINREGNLVGNVPAIVKDIIEQILISYGYLLGRIE